MITRRGIIAGALSAAANSAVTVGVLGTGNRGSYVAAMLHRNTPGRVVALCDVVPEHPLRENDTPLVCGQIDGRDE